MLSNRPLHHELAGRRVLVVEDEYLIALDIGEALESAGAQVVGPAGTITNAATLVRENGFDIAVIDVALLDGDAYSVVDALQAADIPLVFLTGYEKSSLRREYRTLPHLTKPFLHTEFIKALAELMGGRLANEFVAAPSR
jgi:CheY-like chemotaxis protein